jgi:hypothetical protein
MGLRSKFYIRRDADARLEGQVEQPCTITTIRAARQTGKSSLLVRGMYHARQLGAKVIHIDLQRVDREYLQEYDGFLRFLAEFVVRKLRLDLDEVDRSWHSARGPQDKFIHLMEGYVLPEVEESTIRAPEPAAPSSGEGAARPESETPVLVAMDEADR